MNELSVDILVMSVYCIYWVTYRFHWSPWTHSGLCQESQGVCLLNSKINNRASWVENWFLLWASTKAVSTYFIKIDSMSYHQSVQGFFPWVKSFNMLNLCMYKKLHASAGQEEIVWFDTCLHWFTLNPGNSLWLWRQLQDTDLSMNKDKAACVYERQRERGKKRVIKEDRE